MNKINGNYQSRASSNLPNVYNNSAFFPHKIYLPELNCKLLS